MASVNKRGDAYTVRYHYTDSRGNPCQGWESFKSKKEAENRKLSVENELKNGTFLIPSDITVRELLEQWVPIQSNKHKWAPKTYTQTMSLIQNLICPYIGTLKVQDTRTYHIERLYSTLSQTPCGQYVHGEKQNLTPKQQKRLLSGSSIHEVHALLKTAFSYAVEWDLIHKSPVPRDGPKLDTAERTIWDEQTMLAALQTIENPALHLAVHMSMILSLREGEILGIQPGDLDFEAADGRGTIAITKTLQRASKVSLAKTNSKQIYYVFPDKREGSKSSLILKTTKTEKSTRVVFMTRQLREELLAWLEKLKADEASKPDQYQNCGQLFRLEDGTPIAPDVMTKWYRQWRAAHPEFAQIVFHDLRHSSATYQLKESDGDYKAVQGNTGHSTADTLMNVYAHMQDRSRVQLAEKLEANFYKDAANPNANETKMPNGEFQITGKMILEAIQQADSETKRELARALFA
jgi:integrase